MVPTGILLGIALLGGLAHVVVTVLWYQPMGNVPTPPIPLLESAVFGLTFTIVYVLMGIGIRAVATFWPPYTGYLLLAVSTIALIAMVLFATGRVGEDRRTVERAMSVIMAGMCWLIPLLVLILGSSGG